MHDAISPEIPEYRENKINKRKNSYVYHINGGGGGASLESHGATRPEILESRRQIHRFLLCLSEMRVCVCVPRFLRRVVLCVG